MNKKTFIGSTFAAVAAIVAASSFISCSSDDEYYEGGNYTLANKRMTRGEITVIPTPQDSIRDDNDKDETDGDTLRSPYRTFSEVCVKCYYCGDEPWQGKDVYVSGEIYKYKESNYYVGEVTDVKIDIPVTGPNVYVNSAGEFGASINVTFTTLLGYGYMGSTYISY